MNILINHRLYEVGVDQRLADIFFSFTDTFISIAFHQQFWQIVLSTANMVFTNHANRIEQLYHWWGQGGGWLYAPLQNITSMCAMKKIHPHSHTLCA